jgi:hypothetical protein
MEDASVVEPPANGQASFTVSDATAPDTAPGEGVAVSMDVTTGSASPQRKRAAATDCSLAVVLDGLVVYNETLVDNGGATTTIQSNPVEVSGNTTLQVVETCGDNPVPAILSNVLLVAAPLSAPTSTGSGSPTSTGGSSGTVSPTGSGTVTPTGSNGTVTPTGTMPTTTASATPGFPSVIGDFVFYGCIGSNNNFPTFQLSGSSAQMDLETCTTICADSTFAGVFAR